MQSSFLLKETDKDKEEENNEMDVRRHQRHRTAARALSLPTTRRTHMTLPDMRRGVFLPDFLLFHCAQTRDRIIDCLAVHLEPLVRTAVREELRLVIDFFKDFNLPQRLLPDRNTEAQYRLRFINRVKNPTFTDDPVTDEKGAPIEVAICDSHTRSIIPPDCCLSSAKVRMTVLNAELWKSKGANWTTSEFNHSILKERDGKGPILIGGDLTFRLQNGRGTFGNLVFKDNSSWTKSGFRLGVMIEVEGEAAVERVQEAVSESFRVKDRRGKASQKPGLLKQTDKVQSIKNIGKDRASLLEKNNINTVEDFLLSYYNDQNKLRTMLGIKSESDKGWKNMVGHAMECDNEYQAKYNVRDSGAHPQQVSVGQQVNIVYPSMDQLYADVPVDSNTNLVPTQEVLHGSSFHQEQFCISSENMAENTILCDNESQAGYNTLSNMGLPQQVSMDEQINPAHPNCNPISVATVSNSTFPVSPLEEVLLGIICDQDPLGSAAFAHMPERSVPLETTVGPRIVGSSSSVPNPLENNLIYPVTGLQIEIPEGPDPMEDMLANEVSCPNNYSEFQPTSRSNSFDIDSLGELVEGFQASINSLTPRRKRNVKAIFMAISFLASPRKKARRILPPANQALQLSCYQCKFHSSVFVNLLQHGRACTVCVTFSCCSFQLNL